MLYGQSERLLFFYGWLVEKSTEQKHAISRRYIFRGGIKNLVAFGNQTSKDNPDPKWLESNKSDRDITMGTQKTETAFSWWRNWTSKQCQLNE